MAGSPGAPKRNFGLRARLRMGLLILTAGVGFACAGTGVVAGDPTAEPVVVVVTATPQSPATNFQNPPPVAQTPEPPAVDSASPETFRDSFDNPVGWAEVNLDRYATGRGEGGVYRVEFFIPGDDQVVVVDQPHLFALPLIDMEVRTEGTAMNWEGAYGLVCRRADDSNYVTFHISTDGRYWLYQKVDGAWTNLGSGTSGSIREDNALSLRCVGDGITASVNGAVLEKAVDGHPITGNGGLFAQPLGGSGLGAWSYYVAFTSFEMTLYP